MIPLIRGIPYHVEPFSFEFHISKHNGIVDRLIIFFNRMNMCSSVKFHHNKVYSRPVELNAFFQKTVDNIDDAFKYFVFLLVYIQKKRLVQNIAFQFLKSYSYYIDFFSSLGRIWHAHKLLQKDKFDHISYNLKKPEMSKISRY